MNRRTTSLRLKLTLWYMAVFAGLQILLLALALWVRRGAVEEVHRAAMGEAAATMVDNILVAEYDLTSAEGMRTLVPADLPLRFFAIRDPAGNGLASTPGLDLERVAFGEEEVVAVGPLESRFRPIQDPLDDSLDAETDPLLLVTLPFRHPEGTFFLQVAVPGPDWRYAFTVFRDQFLFGISIGLFAAWVAAWFISGRAVSPLRRISAAAQDVSIEKLGERIHTDARDEEVRHLEGELNHALSRIEAGYRAHERFMEAVSHELNTPVAVLLTEAQTMKGVPLSEAEIEEFRLSVEEEMRRLQTLVRSLLSLSKADFVQQQDEVAFDDVVTSSVDHCEPLARGRGIHLVLSGPGADAPELPDLVGDRWLLETMIENLLRNAIRVSPPDGAVDVGWGEADGHLTVSVRDRGPGIPEDYLERIFDPFVQVPRDQKRLGGTGLGLSIALRIAEVHGGSINVRNNDDGGCSFTVRLPLRASPEPVRSSA